MSISLNKTSNLYPSIPGASEGRNLSTNNSSIDKNRKRLNATIKIQSFMRMYQANQAFQKKTPHLPISKFNPFSDIDPLRIVIDQDLLKNWSSNLPPAFVQLDHDDTYMHLETQIVLKDCLNNGRGRKGWNKHRFEQMNAARQICQKHNLKRLLIPKARTYDNYILEEGLPIHHTDTKASIGLYYENIEKFNQVVQEFCVFLCHSYLWDYVGNARNPYQEAAPGLPIGRYDNICLILSNDNGEIGLIDLENFKPNHSGSVKTTVLNLITLFPYHYGQIIATAQRFDEAISLENEEFVTRRNQVIEFFNQIYVNHREFVESKGISTNSPNSTITLSETQRTSIKERLRDTLQSIHSRQYYITPKRLGTDQDVIDASFKELYEKTFNSIIDDIVSKLNKIAFFKNSPKSINEILSKRTYKIYSSRCSPFFGSIFNYINTAPMFRNNNEYNEKYLSLINVTTQLQSCIFSLFVQERIIYKCLYIGDGPGSEWIFV